MTTASNLLFAAGQEPGTFDFGATPSETYGEVPPTVQGRGTPMVAIVGAAVGGLVALIALALVGKLESTFKGS